MARPEAEPKTELAKRLREVRLALDFKERKRFAKHLGLPESTMSNYETGLREPPASVLIVYKNVCGISLNWLITGEGEMFNNDAASVLNRMIEPRTLTKIASQIEDVLKGLNRKPTKARITEIAAEIYNDLLQTGTDFSDADELDAAIKLEAIKLKKKIINCSGNTEKATTA